MFRTHLDKFIIQLYVSKTTSFVSRVQYKYLLKNVDIFYTIVNLKKKTL